MAWGQRCAHDVEPLADDDGCVVEHAFVHQAASEERAEHASPAFDEDGQDLQASQRVEQRFEIDAAGRGREVEDGDTPIRECATDVVGERRRAGDHRPIGVCVGEQAPIERRRFFGAQNEAYGTPFRAAEPTGERGIILHEGADADEDRVDPGAFTMGVPPGARTRNPARRAAGARDPSVETHGGLRHDVGSTRTNPPCEPANQPGGLFPFESPVGIHAGGAQDVERPSGMTRVGIDDARDDATHLGAKNGLGAGRGPPLCGTWLERDVEGRTARVRAGLRERLDLRMRQSGGTMRPAPDDRAVPHKHRADGRIRTRPADMAAREGECSAHPARVLGRERRSFPVDTRFAHVPGPATAVPSEGVPPDNAEANASGSKG